MLKKLLFSLVLSVGIAALAPAVDSDGDGVDDEWLLLLEALEDTDADGLLDAIEIDADGVGIADLIESGGFDEENTGTIDDFTDGNNDGVDDAVAVVPAMPTDSDADGIPDFQELDSVDDGLSDIQESGGIDANGDGSGCSISPTLLSSGHHSIDLKRVDPMLPMLNVLALAGLAVRRRESSGGDNISPAKYGKAKQVAAASAAALLASTSVNSSDVPYSVPVALPDFNQGPIQEATYESGTETVQQSVPVAIPEFNPGPLQSVANEPESGTVAQSVSVALPDIDLPETASSEINGQSQESERQAKAVFEPLSADELFTSRDNSSRSLGPVTIVPAVSAPTYEDRLSRGLYAVAGIGPSFMEPDTTRVEGWDPNDRVEPAGQLTIGADLTRHLSVEAHTADLGSAGLSAPEQGREGRINYHVNGVSALLYAGGNRNRFRRQGLTAFGRLGYGELENTAIGDVPFRQVNSNHVLFGAGVEYMTSSGFGLRAEGVSFDTDARYAQLGLMYRTGRRQESEQPKIAEVQQPVEPAIAAAIPAADPCVAISGILDGVNFHTDSAGLTHESQLILNNVADTLGGCAQKQVKVTAHTDSIGDEDYNKTLSKKRAVSVVKYLVAQGVELERFEARVFGERQPIASNDTVDGRSQNRRVELYAR